MSATATIPPPATKKPAKAKVPTPVEAPKPAPPAPKHYLDMKCIPPGNERVDYGGKPAYVGAQVWYWHLNVDSKTLEPRPAMLFARGYLNPDSWTLSVFFHSFGDRTPVDNIEYSDEPKLGHWSWPTVPVLCTPEKQPETQPA